MAGMKNKGTLYPLIGVDFGSHTIKAVAVSGKADNFQIVSLAEVPTPKNTIKDSKIVDIDKVVQSTRTLFNMFIAMISGYVHTLRLNYVEFFGKFYTGGGRQFAPIATLQKHILIKNNSTQ